MPVTNPRPAVIGLLAISLCAGLTRADEPGTVLDAWIDQISTGQNDAVRGLGLYPDGRFAAVSSLPQSGGSNSVIVRYNPNGTRDVSFGGYGTGARIDSWGSGNDYLEHCVVQPDNKLVATGLVVGAVKNTGADGFVVRYTGAGLPDTSFGTGGRSIVFASKEADRCFDVAVQPDGKIVAVGGGDNLKGKGLISGPKRTLVGRLLPNGALDSTFGTGGKVALSIGSGSSEAGAVAIQPDGKIVVGGDTPAEGGAMFVLRLNANGTLDTGFGVGGIRFVSVPGARVYSGVGGCLRLRDDGKIILGGTARFASDVMTLVSLNPDGSLDTTFNGTGIQVSQVPASLYSLVLNPDNDTIACGYGRIDGPEGMVVARFTGDGQLDTTFNASGATPGYVFRYIGMPGGFAWTILYRPIDDTILVGGLGFLPDYTGVFGFLRIQN